MEPSLRFNINEVNLVYRRSPQAVDYPVIKNSAEAFEILRDTWDMNRIEHVEQFKVLLLDKANRVLGLYEASTGGTDATIMDAKLIMVAALRANAHGIIVSHNHPSGSLKPSASDVANTKKLKDAGKVLTIPLLDHIIVTASDFLSFSDKGLI